MAKTAGPVSLSLSALAVMDRGHRLLSEANEELEAGGKAIVRLLNDLVPCEKGWRQDVDYTVPDYPLFCFFGVIAGKEVVISTRYRGASGRGMCRMFHPGRVGSEEDINEDCVLLPGQRAIGQRKDLILRNSPDLRVVLRSIERFIAAGCPPLEF